MWYYLKRFQGCLTSNSLPLRLRPPSEKNFTFAPRRSRPSKYLRDGLQDFNEVEEALKMFQMFEASLPETKGSVSGFQSSRFQRGSRAWAQTACPYQILSCFWDSKVSRFDMPLFRVFALQVSNNPFLPLVGGFAEMLYVLPWHEVSGAETVLLVALWKQKPPSTA